MSGLFRVFVVVASVWSMSGEPFKMASAQPLSDIRLLTLDPQNQIDNNVIDDGWSAVVLKRAGFWSPHQSDFNPMRRPNPVLRPSSKRDYDELPYHPLAKAFSLKQRYVGDFDYPDLAVDNAAELRLKKHIWPANLPYRLGNNGYSNAPPRKGQKFVPSEPNNSVSSNNP